MSSIITQVGQALSSAKKSILVKTSPSPDDYGSKKELPVNEYTILDAGVGRDSPSKKQLIIHNEDSCACTTGHFCVEHDNHGVPMVVLKLPTGGHFSED